MDCRIGSGEGGNFSSSDSLIATHDNQTQTEIIYTVFVNGMPVLAKIAAIDMQLMSDTEVSSILDMDVHIKAERKESISTRLLFFFFKFVHMKSK